MKKFTYSIVKGVLDAYTQADETCCDRSEPCLATSAEEDSCPSCLIYFRFKQLLDALT